MLSSEAERLVTESKVSAGKVTNYHMELVQKQRSEMELSDKIRRLEGEIQQVNHLHVKVFFAKMGILFFFLTEFSLTCKHTCKLIEVFTLQRSSTLAGLVWAAVTS